MNGRINWLIKKKTPNLAGPSLVYNVANKQINKIKRIYSINCS